ncbi:nucleotide sugar dehydrogenase [Candidatus Bathyarchaeota archaeon]|nr:nucleotide sugar dehydrogenase [Candidatus Bathyarchaeota archaeon]
MGFRFSQDYIKRFVQRKDLKLAVYGLGRVGLPLAVAWLRAGYEVIGADVDEDKVEIIHRGLSPIGDEPGIEESIKRCVSEGRFKATTNLIDASEKSEVKFITVPTTQRARRFDDYALKAALEAIGKGLKEGDAVAIECSVPPTTTVRFAQPILEEESGLKAEKEFALAFSPERIFEGRALEDIEIRYPKIVGGVGPYSTELFAELYQRIARKGVIKMRSATEAEISKLFEGVYRDVNIALANELAKLCKAMNIDFAEISEASNSQPFCHLHKPGVGVGGACIPYYPYFLLDKAEECGVQLPIVRLARNANEEMPKYTVETSKKALEAIGKNLKDVKVSILGLAFRAEVSDSRNSPTYNIIYALKEYQPEIIVHDPFIKEDELLHELRVKLVDCLETACENASLLIIATGHGVYKKIDLEELVKTLNLPAAIVDGCNVIDSNRVPKGIYLTSLWGKTINKL